MHQADSTIRPVSERQARTLPRGGEDEDVQVALDDEGLAPALHDALGLRPQQVESLLRHHRLQGGGRRQVKVKRGQLLKQPVNISVITGFRGVVAAARSRSNVVSF